MNNTVLSTPSADAAIWKDDNLIEDAAAKEKEADLAIEAAETTLKDSLFTNTHATPHFKADLALSLQCLLYLWSYYYTEYPLNSIPTYIKIAISCDPTLVSTQKLKRIKNAFFGSYLATFDLLTSTYPLQIFHLKANFPSNTVVSV